MGSRQAVVAEATRLADDDKYGYDQPTARNPNSWDLDCSELVRICIAKGGYPTPSYLWTGNMHSELGKLGYTWVPGAACTAAQPGDIPWKTGHTAIYIGNNTIVEASLNEFGGITGGRPGDQTGQEIRRIRWNYTTWAGYFQLPNKSSAVDAVRKGDPEMAFRFSNKGTVYLASMGTGTFYGVPSPEFDRVLLKMPGVETLGAVNDRERDIIRDLCARARDSSNPSVPASITASVDPKAIANAIPADLAQQVVDALAERLNK